MNIQEFKKVVDSKMSKIHNNYSILFETINTQHVCLEDIWDRIPRQEKTLEKFKRILDLKLSDNTLKVRDSKNDMIHINEKLEAISNGMSDLQETVHLLQQESEMLHDKYGHNAQTEKTSEQS